jgi:DinB family protein/pentapeptide repeat protein
MATFSGSDDLQGATFVNVNLRGARFAQSDLSGIVMRGVDVSSADIDAPWLPDGTFLVNGVDVVPYVEAELDRRFPGRASRRASDPEGLRDAWTALQTAWDSTMERAAAMPPGTVDISVDGEWSFAQTLRHLILATDMWFGRGVLELEQPFHPLGLTDSSMEEEGKDMSVFAKTEPTYAEILQARAEHVALIRDFLATVTPDELATPRKNPHNPEHAETTRNCIHVILEEEWEHLRFAIRDLDAIEAKSDG